MILLQGGIILTGNFAFFNWLTIALCLPLFDDRFWSRGSAPSTEPEKARFPEWKYTVAGAIALFDLVATFPSLIGSFRIPAPDPVGNVFGSLRSFNGYGLFRVMTTERPEIIVEGSNDGVEWRAYEFKWKPGEVNRRPRLVAPHQPRLDWQMWFAALGRYPGNPWVGQFLQRLLQGSRDVLTLLGTNPFPHQPPRFIRAVFYNYRFTDFATRKATGAWWRRERRGFYSPVLLQRGPLSKKAPADDPEPG
jgi:hypothetical protein